MPDVKSHKTPVLKKRMLEALESSLGVVSVAAKKANIHRNAHYNWLLKDPEYAAAVAEMDLIQLDFGLSKLFQRCNEGSDQAIIFLVKAKGRKYGWSEKVEIEHSGEIQQQHFILKIGNAVIPDDRGATTSGAANDMGEPE